MANNNASGTFAPCIPTNLITDEFRKLADAVGLSIKPFNDDGDMVYLFNCEDYCTSGYIENEDGTEKEVTDEDLYAAIQDIIRNSEGKLTWVSHEQAYTCDKMRSGEFGGSAVFITADDIQYHGTSSWLEQRIHEAETGDFGPNTEDNANPSDILRDEALLLACSHFLCDDDELTPIEQYQALEKAENGYIPQGVVAWEPFENFTATDLYNDIEDLRDLILRGMEFAQTANNPDVQRTDTITPEDTTVNVDDAIEAANDLIEAAKVVVERWENAAHADLAQAVANLDVVIGWTEQTLDELKNHKSVPADWEPIIFSQAAKLLKDLVGMLSEVEDIEHDQFGCQEECALCAAKNYIAKIEEGQHPPINLAIVLDGGLVQAVVTDAPEAFKGVNTMIIDYDTDGPFVENDSLGIVPQGDGDLKSAYTYATSIENAGIDLTRAADFVTDRAYGANQERFAICGHNPCENCKDCNFDGERCVNEDKCLAWQYYNN